MRILAGGLMLAFFILSVGCSDQSMQQPVIVIERCKDGSHFKRAQEVTVYSRRMLPRSSRQETVVVAGCMMERVSMCNPYYKGALKCESTKSEDIGESVPEYLFEDEIK